MNNIFIEWASIAVEGVTEVVKSIAVHDYFTNLCFIGPTSIRIKSRLPAYF
jgi:hypothetical protein